MRRLLGPVLLAALAATLLALSAAPALGNHVQCGDIVTQDTKLDSDLISCPDNGIVIGADNITLDLNGHTIAGIASIYPAGVFNSGFDGVTVKGGEIKWFRAGVEFLGVRRSTIVDTSLMNYGGVRLEGENNRVERNVISSGERDYGHGVILLYGSGNRVFDNSVRSAGVGLTVFESGRNRIESNSVSESYSGLSMIAGTDNLVRRNDIETHGEYAVLMQEAVRNLFEDNSISSGRNGIIVTGSNDNRIRTNSVTASRGNGVGYHHTVSGELTRNRILDNGRHGVYVVYGTSAIQIERNVVSHNVEDGIHVDGSYGGGASVISNTASHNGDDGLQVGATDSLVRKNTADYNADLGIEAVAEIWDGGGNRAFGNGNPLQCLNVACR